MKKKTFTKKQLTKLLKTFPELENITQEKHSFKGTLVLLNKNANRKYYVYSSGYAKAVNADNGYLTDFINAWHSNWKDCKPYSTDILLELLGNYINCHRESPREEIWGYHGDRKHPKRNMFPYNMF